jgi:hypothetical protein
MFGRVDLELMGGLILRCPLDCMGWVGLIVRCQSPLFGAAFFQTSALGEILNPAQRIRVEGFEHMTTAGARQAITVVTCYDALFDVLQSSLLPSLPLSSRFSVLKREAARHHISSPRSVPSQSIISFCEHQRSSQHRWSRSPRVFKKKNANLHPALSRPTPAKTVACFFTLIFLMARVMWGCRDYFHGVAEYMTV